MRRTLWEAVVALVLVAALFGLWRWSQINAQRAVGEQLVAWQQERHTLEAGYEDWTFELAKHEATEVFLAFAAGIQPEVMAGRHDPLEAAKRQLLKLDAVAFVHLLEPDGSVIITSDDKYATTGKADERGAWALMSREGLETRDGEVPGTVELASPILGTSGPEAVLWIGYKMGAVLRATRPATLPQP